MIFVVISFVCWWRPLGKLAQRSLPFHTRITASIQRAEYSSIAYSRCSAIFFAVAAAVVVSRRDALIINASSSRETWYTYTHTHAHSSWYSYTLTRAHSSWYLYTLHARTLLGIHTHLCALTVLVEKSTCRVRTYMALFGGHPSRLPPPGKKNEQRSSTPIHLYMQYNTGLSGYKCPAHRSTTPTPLYVQYNTGLSGYMCPVHGSSTLNTSIRAV